jgi:hypothetical protein
MMRSFMTLGFFTWGAELNEGSNRSDMMSFPEENTVMTIYGDVAHWGGTTCLA